MHSRSRITTKVAMSGVLASVVALSGCGTDDSGHAHEHTPGAEPIALTYDGGIYVLDGASLDKRGEVTLDGFNRLNPAGDDDHLVVSTKDGFRVFDAYDADFTGTDFPAGKPGHVVRHAGKTVLFADGSGEVTIIDTDQIGTEKPATEVYQAAEPHHGVAVELSNGELVLTLGTEETRTGLVALDGDRKELARNEDCPGVHGEATAQDEAVIVGCQTGAVVYRDGEFTKVTSPTPYGRIGNMSGSEVSPIVLGDYKQDKEAELERPQQISLVNTTDASLRLIDIGTSYTFRSLGRGPQGEALVLGTDGKIHEIDPVAGTVTRTIPVIDTWSEPLDWQEARPSLFVRGGIAYVSDPANKRVHRVDLADGKITATATLDAAPNEITGVAGH
ncbi:zinc metallochaperone AztD [Nocardia mangyaensis]|uniref:zinc metallochaperone AztD n=1 Tax=Nocardia mangyaensis TaxID=2213200 RepID=UPI002675CF70|nr:zinc metallochaperone AztD [Nocardia mangyaensis]MDO3648639.1 zinc metallochaperone AztD [Nocardia mangyaensis]